jgi:hypothetical protein
MISEMTKKNIDSMNQVSMAALHRNAPSGHPYFQGEVGEYFQKKFKEKGGMTAEISKQVGW